MLRIGFLLLLSTLIVASARAEEPAPQDDAPNYADTLSGDWGGQRRALYRAGVATEITWKADFMRAQGGSRNGSGKISNLDLKARVDLDKLLGWSAATAYLHVLDNRGRQFNARDVGSITGVSNIEVPAATAKFFHAWVQQSFMDERWSLLGGLYPVDSEFSGMDSAGLLVNPSYGASADFALTRGPSIFNTSAFGLRLKWSAADRGSYVMGALLDGRPGDPNNPYGTHIRFDRGDGAFWIVEAGLLPRQDPPATPAAEDHGGNDGEFFSKLAFGLWRYTAHADDLVDVDASGTPLRHISHGAYALAERTLYRLEADPARSLSGFARYSLTDGNSTPIRSALNLGLRQRGLFAARKEDILSCGITIAQLSDKYRQVLSTAGSNPARGENTLELAYRTSLTPWLSLQPGYQYISHPGGSLNVPAVRVLGLRMEMAI
ncbi:MAG TPA: carbohydrate porin [Rhodocyclaceae bacterium]